MVSIDSNEVGLCNQAIPPAEFFTQRISLHANGGTTRVTDFTETVTETATASTQQTMHNSNHFDTVACPEAATIIISILSDLMRPVSILIMVLFETFDLVTME